MEKKPSAHKAGRVLLTILGWLMLIIGLLVTLTGIGFLSEEGADNRGLAAMSLGMFGCMAVGGLLIILRHRIWGGKRETPVADVSEQIPAAKKGGNKKKAALITVLVFVIIAVPTVLLSVYAELRSRYDNPPPMLFTDTQVSAVRNYFGQEELDEITLSEKPAGKAPTKTAPWIAFRLKGYETKEKTGGITLLRPVGWSEAYRWQVAEYRETELNREEWEKVQTIVLCRYGQWTASYGYLSASNAVSKGTSEYVDVYYVNADTGDVYEYERYGRVLPEKTSKAPHYTVTDEDLTDHITLKMKGIS